VSENILWKKREEDKWRKTVEEEKDRYKWEEIGGKVENTGGKNREEI
jgi:hypothetical protein